uniref:Inosine-5'-monophosphate dehydrogenase n=1 Tax=Vibrio cholerae serotype O1 (strain ATCC 39315 / El Tor Inaba N16961) TaxID=243277 RepID=UPI0002662B4D|nr:Chain A, Inosine-5'-monophosphate dehydrogenase [Vibrio cholerae O1 biovar El Tor str. N16961]4FEZ_B Chain B, Inosine-5'-monophosphate dehydrogenase [Vibrio cholerae O1 biovar El Tor str. N16961]
SNAMHMLRIAKEALTFDDVLLVPAHSTVLPNTADLRTRLTKNIALNIPMVSASMDTVTEARLAIALAQEGGIGFIHKNMSIEQQAAQVHQVKIFESGGAKDFHKAESKPNACKDEQGRLRVGAAVGAAPGNEERVKALVEAGVDVLLIDSSHGHSEGVLQRIRETRAAYPHLEIIGGNVATAEGARALIEAGVSAVKVGIGPGSICTTRIVTGVGVPQITAIADAAGVANEYGIPVIADGGIRFSGDISKAIAAGASCVMVGSMFAGTEEAPGEVILYQGRSYKAYRGMGSLGAMSKGSSDRYFQTDNAADKLVPEGIEGRIAYKGHLKEIIHQQMGGLRSCMGLTGSATVEDLRTKAQFVRISGAGMKESHVHDVQITKEAPNYRLG